MYVCLVAQSCPTLCNSMDCSPSGSSVSGDSPGKNTGVGCHALLQGIFPTQGLSPGVLHCRRILYWLSHQGSPRILERVACPLSTGSSQPRNWTWVSYIAGGFFTSWVTREAHVNVYIHTHICIYMCIYVHRHTMGFLWWLSDKESACQPRRLGFAPWVGKIPRRRKWKPIQYSCLTEELQAIIQRVTSWTWLGDWACVHT